MPTTLLGHIAADLDWMYDVTYGHAKTVTGPAGAIAALVGADFYAADPGATLTVASSQPTLRTREADAIARGATVTIDTIAYVVIERRPNGYGEVIHALQAA